MPDSKSNAQTIEADVHEAAETALGAAETAAEQTEKQIVPIAVEGAEQVVPAAVRSAEDRIKAFMTGQAGSSVTAPAQAPTDPPSGQLPGLGQTLVTGGAVDLAAQAAQEAEHKQIAADVVNETLHYIEAAIAKLPVVPGERHTGSARSALSFVTSHLTRYLHDLHL
jgi:hypothetical protein